MADNKSAPKPEFLASSSSSLNRNKSLYQLYTKWFNAKHLLLEEPNHKKKMKLKKSAGKLKRELSTHVQHDTGKNHMVTDLELVLWGYYIDLLVTYALFEETTLNRLCGEEQINYLVSRPSDTPCTREEQFLASRGLLSHYVSDAMINMRLQMESEFQGAKQGFIPMSEFMEKLKHENMLEYSPVYRAFSEIVELCKEDRSESEDAKVKTAVNEAIKMINPARLENHPVSSSELKLWLNMCRQSMKMEMVTLLFRSLLNAPSNIDAVLRQDAKYQRYVKDPATYTKYEMKLSTDIACLEYMMQATIYFTHQLDETEEDGEWSVKKGAETFTETNTESSN